MIEKREEKKERKKEKERERKRERKRTERSKKRRGTTEINRTRRSFMIGDTKHIYMIFTYKIKLLSGQKSPSFAFKGWVFGVFVSCFVCLDFLPNVMMTTGINYNNNNKKKDKRINIFYLQTREYLGREWKGKGSFKLFQKFQTFS